MVSSISSGWVMDTAWPVSQALSVSSVLLRNICARDVPCWMLSGGIPVKRPRAMRFCSA